jgi:hypothetical protein
VACFGEFESVTPVVHDVLWRVRECDTGSDVLWRVRECDTGSDRRAHAAFDLELRGKLACTCSALCNNSTDHIALCRVVHCVTVDQQSGERTLCTCSYTVCTCKLTVRIPHQRSSLRCIQVLPAVPALAQLSRSVWVVLGLNPGPYTLTGTNTYLVGTGRKRVLVDTGDGRAEYIPHLEAALAKAGATGLQEIIVTHWHHDHLGGVPSVVRRFGAVPVRKFMLEVPEKTYGGEGATGPFDTWPQDGFVALKDGETIVTEGATLEVLHTPGHADDHVTLVHKVRFNALLPTTFTTLPHIHFHLPLPLHLTDLP